jgi:bifunctional DNA-binding transcriptional regulator/antitoxin component of YhaV-PrlF toxin-antitoxin module/mRNA-degrading endonuclease RelE of RelBE toxin-antitoxin system
VSRASPASSRVITAVLRDRGRLTLPDELRRELGLADGDTMILLRTERGLELLPAAVVPRDQLWSCTRTVQAALEEAAGPVSDGSGAVLITRRFRRRMDRLSEPQRKFCEAAIRRLREDPGARSLRIRPVPGSRGVLEARFGYRGRILHRRDGDALILLDVYGPREIARLERRASGWVGSVSQPRSTLDP